MAEETILLSELSAMTGKIVACRRRTWVVLPSGNPDVIRLRPLSGNENEICGVYLPLENDIKPAKFPLPQPESIQDLTAAQLLLDATRLNLRSGGGPFRSLGHISVRPRPYQIVPLLMALRQQVVRLLIADAVGIGKTIETALIARELLDRGEIKRLAVLCPPQLCDQWQRELKEKFHIDAVVIRSGTASKLERGLPSNDHHIFSYYPNIIVSLDYAKSDRRRASFLVHCPDLVIVDEVHTATMSNKDAAIQQRHQLVSEIAANPKQHLILLTATPHSGIETSFLSILGLLKPEFEQYDLENLTEGQRVELAKHFIQRRRADVQHWQGNETPFPERDSLELSYNLSQEYKNLFEQVYDFARGLVRETDPSLSYAQRREGRIDRYGQQTPKVKCILLYGSDNPVDGAVLEVLLRKAVKIHKSLGITVPVPMDSHSVQEAVFKSLFERATDVRQLTIFDIMEDSDSPLAQVHQSWDRAVEREKQNRTRFAQRSIKAEEVERELIESDLVLGNEADVERFVVAACKRLESPLTQKKGYYYLPNIPLCVQDILGDKPRTIIFVTPAPEAVEYIGRNHPLVERLAHYLFENALLSSNSPIASRCGVTVTDAIFKATTILLLRLRHLLESRNHQSLLAEECLVKSFTGLPNKPQWLPQEETLSLLTTVEPKGDLSAENKRSRLENILNRLEELQPELEQIAINRAEILADSHQRVRIMTKQGKVSVTPQLPMDILGVYCLLPK